MKIMKMDLKEKEPATSYFLLKAIELRKSKKEQFFLSVLLADRTGDIRGYLWKDASAAFPLLKEKSFVKVKGTPKTINDSLAIDIEKIRTAEKNEVDLNDFLEIVPGGVDLWEKKLHEVVCEIEDAECRRLIESFLKDPSFYDSFRASPGGVTVHHNYIGGLLEHTVNTMQQGLVISERYPELIDRDLLITGAFLHDIGKTKELRCDIVREYTTEGKLLGHILIGFSMIDEKISQMEDFPGDLAMVLKHMIISHHGEPDFGSPVRPAIPEALALHMIDNADAKLNHLNCHLKNSNKDDTWSQFDRFLKTEIYRQRVTITGKREVTCT